ncbi:MAG TPA: LysE/ArgO family amino acid transporter [Frankiaceae bacterium]|nr:LysE/ArgO family amino acid transporter [Frankiaceae bacterium]
MTWSPFLAAAASGLGLGLSLIIVIGAQNAFVLRQGLGGEHVRLVVALCTLSDVVLIGAGVLGAGAVLTRVPGLLTAVRIAGGAFLLGYGILAARRAWRPAVLVADASRKNAGWAATAATCLALTWLNPHVYLDTVVLLGAIANTHHGQRWSFAAGAALASTAWFTGLGYGARLLRPVFARRTAWRILDAVIAVVMAALGTLLIVSA